MSYSSSRLRRTSAAAPANPRNATIMPIGIAVSPVWSAGAVVVVPVYEAVVVVVVVVVELVVVVVVVDVSVVVVVVVVELVSSSC